MPKSSRRSCENAATGQCTPDCRINICGDGYVYEGFEDCDDGNAVNTDDCIDPDAANAPIEGTIKIGSAMPLTGGVAAADAFKERFHLVHPALVADGGIHHLGQRPGPGGAHQWARGNQVGEIQRGNSELLALLHHRSCSDRQIWLDSLHRGAVIFKAGAVLHRHPLGAQPVRIRRRPRRFRAGGADIGHIRAAFDQKTRDQQLATLIPRQGDRSVDRRTGQRALDRGQERVLRRRDLVSG